MRTLQTKVPDTDEVSGLQILLLKNGDANDCMLFREWQRETSPCHLNDHATQTLATIPSPLSA